MSELSGAGVAGGAVDTPAGDYTLMDQLHPSMQQPLTPHPHQKNSPSYGLSPMVTELHTFE